MADFLRNLSQPSWWISVVVVGVAVNLLSNYVYSATGSFLGGFKLGWRNARARQREQRLQLVESLRADQRKRERYRASMEEYRHDEITLMMWMIGFVLLSMVGVFAMLNSSWRVPIWFTRSALAGAGLSLLTSLTARSRANRVRSLLEEADLSGSE